MSKYFSSKYISLTPYTPGEQPKEKKYVNAMQMLMLSYLFNSKWNNTFRDTAFVKDATPIANKLKWDSEKIDILAQIISDQVKRKNYDEGALIKSFQKALSQFDL